VYKKQLEDQEEMCMSLAEIVVLIIIAAASGALGQAIAGHSLGGGSLRGWMITTLVGFIGALIGTWLARLLELPFLLPITPGGQTFPIVWAVIGAAILALVVGEVNRRRRK
jgi:uncharacterized membrane protein YeaQ/YmgE (transglycosylase-associated protein family)